ncbi:hypothetical protein HAX54_012433 [Datura stramonium]|uniref:Uncharacterized protein n=1 Tax=Datura stramonium TaxID=4076 RepID=A0ABS8TLK6_DATST|nr:hypothetical protein [Datura stramonium]
MMNDLNLKQSARRKTGDMRATSPHLRLAGATQEDLEVAGTRSMRRKLVSRNRKCYAGGLEGTLLRPIDGLRAESPLMRNAGASVSGSRLLRRTSSKKASTYLRSFQGLFLGSVQGIYTDFFTPFVETLYYIIENIKE